MANSNQFKGSVLCVDGGFICETRPEKENERGVRTWVSRNSTDVKTSHIVCETEGESRDSDGNTQQMIVQSSEWVDAAHSPVLSVRCKVWKCI